VARPPYLLGTSTVSITASVGWVIAVADSSTVESLLREADGAMYRAKRARRAAPVAIDLRPRAPRVSPVAADDGP